MAANDTAVLRELVAQKPEFKRISIILDALELWTSSPSIRDQVRVHGRQSGIDVLDFLDRLPQKLGYESVEQLICGYQPVGDVISPEEKDGFERWNKLSRQALTVARRPADDDWMELYEPVRALFNDLAEFVGGKYRLYQFTKEARASRPH
jgi:hypothetical protein